METKKLKQQAIFKVAPHKVYEALMDSKMHAKFSKMPARISRKVGGRFTAYGKYIDGKNLKLIKDRKIVQMWRGSEWPKGHYSKVTFELMRKGKNTVLKFTQTGIPAKELKHMSSGWKEHYWRKMKKMLEKK